MPPKAPKRARSCESTLREMYVSGLSFEYRMEPTPRKTILVCPMIAGCDRVSMVFEVLCLLFSSKSNSDFRVNSLWSFEELGYRRTMSGHSQVGRQLRGPTCLVGGTHASDVVQSTQEIREEESDRQRQRTMKGTLRVMPRIPLGFVAIATIASAAYAYGSR